RLRGRVHMHGHPLAVVEDLRQPAQAVVPGGVLDAHHHLRGRLHHISQQHRLRAYGHLGEALVRLGHFVRCFGGGGKPPFADLSPGAYLVLGLAQAQPPPGADPVPGDPCRGEREDSTAPGHYVDDVLSSDHFCSSLDSLRVTDLLPPQGRRPIRRHGRRSAHPRGPSACHALTAPAVMPLTKWRWKITNNTITGTEPSTLIAMIWFHS